MHKPNVLLVDDDIDVLTTVSDMAAEAGVSTISACNGEDAVEILQTNALLSGVLADVWMDDLNGLELISRLSQPAFTGRRLRLGLMTGKSTLVELDDVARLPIDVFLRKPIEGAQLVAALEILAHPTAPDDDRLRVVQHLRAQERRNSVIFSEQSFDVYGWRMFLELVQAHLVGEAVPVGAVCAASGAPHTTALRRLDELVEEGLAQRLPDPGHGKRIIVRLTPEGLTRFDQLVKLHFLNAASPADLGGGHDVERAAPADEKVHRRHLPLYTPQNST